MLKLMKLELHKFKMMGYVRAAAIANVFIFGFMILMSYTPELDGTIIFRDFNVVFSMVDVFARATFIIFAAVLLGRLVIDEFNSKTITVLFMYPIKRQKIIAAKLIVIIIFTFVGVLASIILLSTLYFIVNTFMHLVPGELTMTLVLQQAVKISFNALAASFMALIPLYFGMRKYSFPTTIVSSIIIVLLTCSNNGGFNLNDIIIIPIGLAIVGAAIGYMAIRKIDQIDIN
ncbi:ABC transporter permease [Paenibacillus sp. N1-5-1-14]|uniref:ABC transporter permease n=1 Tax=Paenibacillus radicibacter TaxID=2972488 RepID=UPI002158CC76|nr:ABC transporter permease [Paenibacillus radicibacter]MCR8643353.1 ABC transporter permease [Paenibacillus radicibacter]